MSFIFDLIRVGVIVGGVYAAKKVYDKFHEKNPDGVAPEDKMNAYKDAANEVRDEVAETIREKAPEFKDKINAGVQKASDYAVDKLPTAVSSIQKAVDQVAGYVEKNLSQTKNEEPQETPTEEVYDAEYTSAEDDKEE